MSAPRRRHVGTSQTPKDLSSRSATERSCRQSVADAARTLSTASYRARQDVQSSRGGPLVDRQRRQQQHRRAFGRDEQSIATAFVVDGVRVVLVADINPNRQALDANRRRAVELELQQADAEILAH